MRVIINGGRNYQLQEGDIGLLDELHADHDFKTVLTGCANGADAIGEYWAQMRFIPVWRFPAEWEKHGKSAGPKRNQAMVDVADMVVSFPGGRGTEDLIRRAKAKGLEVIRLRQK